MDQSTSGSVSAPMTSLSEADMIDAICPQCGYNGKMQIIERNAISGGIRIVLYVICYGVLFLVANILDMIFVPLLPTWFLLVVGLIGTAVAIRGIGNFIKSLSVNKIICPCCKQVLEYKRN